jgi:hemerythrin-like metal-binding protein
MTILEWSPALMVGYQTIDEQHQELVALVNELHDVLSAGNDRARIGDVFQRLLRYIDYHFAFEAELMLREAYPESASHLKEHAGLAARAEALWSTYGAGDEVVGFELLEFLVDWLKDHIVVRDAALATHLRTR